MTSARGVSPPRGVSDTRGRFLRAIAGRVAPERVVEVHLFQPIRQGGVESGIAVIAARPEDVADPGLPAASVTDGPAAALEPAGPGEPAAQSPAPARLTIYRASYRLTLKGGERGRWEVDVAAEADAPLALLDDVVRGVQQRAGEDAPPERFTANDVHAALAEETWIARR